MDNGNIAAVDRRTRSNVSNSGIHGVNSTSFSTQLFIFDQLYMAWQYFCRDKRRRADVALFERNLEAELFSLAEELSYKTYQHGPYVPFTIFDPKQRRIHKATVRDRIVHQLLVNNIEAAFERRFIYDSFSCRKQKGTHRAVQRLHDFLRRASHNNSRKIYTLKCDIRQFFASVDHDILTELLKQQVQDVDTLDLLKVVIESYNGKTGKGIPLGNVTSQLFANVYLHQLDWFVKQQLRERYYARYCDDFIIVSTSRKHLLSLLPPIGDFLNAKLALQLHPSKVSIRSWSQGVDFLGYVLKPYATVLRPKLRRRMLQKVNKANVNSYLGLCSHADTYELQQLVSTLAWQSP